jgi:hypothetical protein
MPGGLTGFDMHITQRSPKDGFQLFFGIISHIVFHHYSLVVVPQHPGHDPHPLPYSGRPHIADVVVVYHPSGIVPLDKVNDLHSVKLWHLVLTGIEKIVEVLGVV